MLKTVVTEKVNTFSDVLKWFMENPTLHPLLSQVKVLVKLLMVLPATNAISERSFSSLRRIKTYLRSTMSETRLNSLMTLHIYKEFLDDIEPQDVILSFIGTNQWRRARIASSW